MTARRSQGRRPAPRSKVPAFFATTLPGLGKLLANEIKANPELELRDERGFDGRADILFFDVRRGNRPDLQGLRVAEDVFVTIAGARSGSPGRVARSLISREDLERALSTWTRFGRHLHTAMTFRAITRVVDEGRFKRTELRNAVTREIAANRPRWRIDDPAALEVWALEYQQGEFVAGVRLSDVRMRQRGDGRNVERQGALRPVVAAAMVQMAGTARGRLLDPCCGSGTIVSEALDVGWQAEGSDIDPDAVAVARSNVSKATIQEADALHLPHADGTFGAVVTNLPFGRQFKVETDQKRWVRDALREAARVTRPGGRVVCLVPPPTPKEPAGLALSGVHALRLLGVSAKIWAYDRLDTPVANGADHRAGTTASGRR